MLLFEKRGIMSPEAVEKAIESISDLPILLDDAPVSFNAQVLLRLARRYNLTAYDAAYLELAVRFKIPLASLDGKLIEAAKAERLALSI
jgi:predicted nucleic acid-binding protein